MDSDFLTGSFLALREKLFRSALGFLKDEEDAADAVQDVYAGLWSKVPVSSGSQAANLLFKALRNRCVDIIRRRYRVARGLGLPEGEGVEPSVAPVEENLENYERLLVSGLSDSQRLVYRYLVHDGYDYERVARITGRSVESIRMDMCRIRKKILSNLKNMDL